MNTTEKNGFLIEQDEDGGHYKIVLPSSWDIHIKEETASCDGRTFLGAKYKGAQIFWIVEPEISFEVLSKEDDVLHFVGKVKCEDKGISRALSNGRVTIRYKHAHKRVLMFIFKKKISQLELSVLKSFVLLK